MVRSFFTSLIFLLFVNNVFSQVLQVPDTTRWLINVSISLLYRNRFAKLWFATLFAACNAKNHELLNNNYEKLSYADMYISIYTVKNGY